jgi:hypothetical protein
LALKLLLQQASTRLNACSESCVVVDAADCVACRPTHSTSVHGKAYVSYNTNSGSRYCKLSTKFGTLLSCNPACRLCCRSPGGIYMPSAQPPQVPPAVDCPTNMTTIGVRSLSVRACGEHMHHNNFTWLMDWLGAPSVSTTPAGNLQRATHQHTACKAHTVRYAHTNEESNLGSHTQCCLHA